MGEGRQALASFDRFLAEGKGDAAAYRQRGFERAKIGRHFEAIVDYTRAVEIAPKAPENPQILARRGWALLDLKILARQALADFEQAIRTDPTNPDLYTGRGYARVLLGEHHPAVADAEKALRLGRAKKELRLRLALHYNAACIFAQAVGQVGTQEPKRDALTQRYETRALELLNGALELLPAKVRGRLLQQALDDPAFAPIRTRPALAKLVARYARSGS